MVSMYFPLANYILRPYDATALESIVSITFLIPIQTVKSVNISTILP